MTTIIYVYNNLSSYFFGMDLQMPQIAPMSTSNVMASRYRHILVSEPGFPTSYIVIFLCSLSSVKMRGDCLFLVLLIFGGIDEHHC